MTVGSIITNKGKQIIINKAYDSTATETVPSKISVGISNSTPDVGDTALDVRIPLGNGTTNDDGSNQLTGSNGGDNSTNNTSEYKEGAGNSDGTAQNLITDGGGADATKTWTIADLTASGSAMSGAQPFGLWLYIKDSTEYAKLVAAGTAIQLRFRTNGDAANKHYLYNRTKAQLSTGWNWITSGTTNIEDLSTGAGGAPSGAIDEFIIEVECANASDEFTSGELVYDLLRQWAESDLTQTFVTGYPVVDSTNFEVEIRGFLVSTQANGFPIDSFALYNTDGTPLMHSEDTFTDESKSSTDQFTFIIKDRLI